MSEDLSSQPSEDTSAGDSIQPQAPAATSLSEDVPLKPPEVVSEDVPDNSPENTSASEDIPTRTTEDASMSKEAPQSPDEASAGEDISAKPLENTHENETVPANVSEDTGISEDTRAKTAEITSASEYTPIKAPARTTKSEPLWLNIVKRVLVGIVMILALLGLIVDMSELVAVWAAYGPARDSVTTVSNTLQQALQAADKGLTRVNGYVTQARQVVTQVNDVVTIVGDNLQNNSPIITALGQRIDTKFSPVLAQAQTNASAVHDAALKANSALDVLNRFPGVTVPTLSDQLTAISDRAQAAQSSMQDLRTTLTNIKTGRVTKVVTAVTNITASIDAPLAKIQLLINTYQAKITNAHDRVTSTENTILTWLLVTAISLTILFLIVAAALLLLFLVCLQYVIYGRFPSLRVVVNKGG